MVDEKKGKGKDKGKREKEPQVPDLFGSAPTAQPVFPTKKSGSSEREVVALGANLDQLAAVKVLISALEGVGGQLEGEMKERAYGIYAQKAISSKKHPSSFVGAGDIATASVEMRRRGSNMPINDTDVINSLKELGVPLTKHVKIPERFTFNNEMLQQEAIRKAISEAFMSHPVLKGIAPQLIVKQEEEFSWTTTDSTLQMAAEKLDIQSYQQFVPYLSTLAIGKFQLNGEAITAGEKGEEKQVTQTAKATAIGMLQDMGVLPPSIKKK